MKYNIVALMSGTSLDGLDVALCQISSSANKWDYKFIHTETFPYSMDMRDNLRQAHKFTAEKLAALNIKLADVFAKAVIKSLDENNFSADFIASHGHTIYHQPEKGFTTQIGCGATMAAKCNLPVIADFRSLDVALGGQGAPLVPVGDKLFFSDFNYCLNLGGIANISFENAVGERIAYDICPVNMALNYLASQAGKEYDKDGLLAKEGKTDIYLLEQLNKLKFYSKKPPKSLGKEWYEDNFLPLLLNSKIKTEDKLRTVTEHIAFQIGLALSRPGKVLITGGGAYNEFLMKRIKEYSTARVVIPDNQSVEFKEALVFALLGALKHENKVNVLSSVTGASRDHSGGIIWNP